MKKSLYSRTAETLNTQLITSRLMKATRVIDSQSIFIYTKVRIPKTGILDDGRTQRVVNVHRFYREH